MSLLKMLNSLVALYWLGNICTTGSPVSRELPMKIMRSK